MVPLSRQGVLFFLIFMISLHHAAQDEVTCPPCSESTTMKPTDPTPKPFTWQIYAIFPTDGKLFYRQELMRPALDYAVEMINNHSVASEILRVQFTGTEHLDTCQKLDTKATYTLISEVTSTAVKEKYEHGSEIVPVAYFGPGCAKTVEDIAKWLSALGGHLPQFDAFAASTNFANRTDYPSLIRTGYTQARFAQFQEEIREQFGWQKEHIYYFVDGADPVWTNIFSPLYNGLSPEERLVQVKDIDKYCSKNKTIEDQDLYRFEDLFRYRDMPVQHFFTAIVIFAHMDCVKSILVKAVTQGMNLPSGQMTFIVSNFFDTPYWGSLELNSTEPNRAALELAYQQTFIASYYVSTVLQQSMAELTVELIRHVRNDPTKYSSPSYLYALENEGVNPTVLSYFAGVYIYAHAMRKVRESNDEEELTDHQKRPLYTRDNSIANLIRQVREFEVPYMGKVSLNKNGDYVGNFGVKYYDPKGNKFSNWLHLAEEATEFKILTNHPYQPQKLPLPIPTEPTPETNPVGAETVSAALIATVTCVILVVVVTAAIIRYYFVKLRATDKWWQIDPAALKYLKTTESERAMAHRPHDTQTMKSVGDHTFIEFLGHEYEHLRLAKYQGQIVAVHEMKRLRKLSLAGGLSKELREIRLHSHTNLLKFYGISVENGVYSTVTDFAYRRTLSDLFVEGQNMEMDWSLRYSLLSDLLEGMIFIHKSFGYHGALSSPKCMIDRTFVLKIDGYAPKELQEHVSVLQPFEKLWTAPEILRRTTGEIDRMTVQERQKADIYSIGIIFQEVIMQCPPYPGPEKPQLIRPPEEINSLVQYGKGQPYRPIVPQEISCSPVCRELMEQAWEEEPNSRPNLGYMKVRLRSVRGHTKGSLFDDLMERIQSYAAQLQQAVEERTMQLREEQHKIQALLYELLPQSVADRLISRRPVEPEPFDCVTIYFSDIVSFTTIAAESTAAEVVNMLNKLYQLFDGIIGHYDAYKVETIGDAYMVVSGLPQRNGTKHASFISKMSLNLLQAAGNFQIPHRPCDKFRMRIGVHSGACVAGVVGNKMPRYCLFGDTVNTASRMESTSLPNQIQLSAITANLIRDSPDFHLESRGIVEVKGKGSMETFWLTPGPILDYFPSPILDNFSYMRQGTLSRQKSKAAS